ncbi:MAG: hypothetical protein ABIN91_24350 [Mucilaginibacter sp.]|uniref:hypothetical protein n=1 Tax=Mucilaginibacter sp. TaxID=1882438 RepID=UPI003264F3D2
MKSKIFNTSLYTLIMVVGLHTIAFSQDVPPAKEKALEEKMVQMEKKLQDMQTKLDSMKVLTRHNLQAAALNGQLFSTSTNGVGIVIDSNGKEVKINGQLYTTKSLKALKVAPRVYKVAPTAPLVVQRYGYTYDGSAAKAYQGVAKSFSHSSNTFTYNSSDKNLDEKIKSGEVKEKTKTFSKSYSVSSGDKLQINNSYGKVTVNTWNKNEFKVDVEIKGIANEEEDAQKLLDGITINDNKDNGVISFTTKIESQNHQWGSWSNNGKSYVNKAVVNYTVYMPSKSALEIKNRFGAVTLPDFKGKLLINTQYGTFTAKDLTNTENDITTRFSDVNIESITGSTLNCQYSNGGGVKIGSANNLKFTGVSISADISTIKSSGEISVRYGDGLKINGLDKNVKILNVNSSFAPVTLSSKNNFDFSVAIRMGGELKYDDDRVKVTNKTPEDSKRFSTTKTYTGYAGKNNSDTKVTINNSYQGVQIL